MVGAYQICLPIIFIAIGFLSIFLLDKKIIGPVMVIIIVLLDFALYMFLVVIVIIPLFLSHMFYLCEQLILAF